MEEFWRRPGVVVVISLLSGVAGAWLVVSGWLPGVRLPNIPTANDQGAIEQAPAYTPQTSHEEKVIQTVEASSPAVVSIVISQDVPVVERYFEQQPSSPLDQFFGTNPLSPFRIEVPRLRQNGVERREIGGGSGFLVSANGLVVTNKHVVSIADANYTVFTQDGKSYDAKILARDPLNDIAIIKIDGNNLPHLTFGDSGALHVGQSVIAIGNALSEFRNTVSVGVISGLSRSIVAGDASGRAEQLDEVIQTDAAINPGNSGGPLLNLAGHVIGVNVAIAQGSENIGFALPANTVKDIVESVQATGKIVRPFLGVRYVDITPVIRDQNKLSVDYGVLVTHGETTQDFAVLPGSPAAKAGLVEGDIILEADGQRLGEKTKLATLVGKKKVGDHIALRILHNGEEKTLNVALEEMPQ